MPEVNYLAVLVAGIAAMVIGGVWYGPLFGSMWMKGMGWDPNDTARKETMKKSAGPAYVQMFIGTLLTAGVLAHILWAFSVAMPGMSGVASGLNAGVWAWVGFVLPVKYGDKLWNGKEFKYVAIDLGYHLVMLLVMGLILGSWK